MNLSELSLVDFLCHGGTLTPASPLAFEGFIAEITPLVSSKVCDLGQGYSIHKLNGRAGNVALKHNDEVVGFYFDEVLVIRCDHRGNDLSVPMILEAVRYRDAPKTRKLSASGEAALKKAWRVANGKEANPWPAV